MGRLKYIKPIYSALVDSGQKTTAEQWNSDNQNFYSTTTELEIYWIINGQTPTKPRRLAYRA